VWQPPRREAEFGHQEFQARKENVSSVDAQSGPSARLDPRANAAARFGPGGPTVAAAKKKYEHKSSSSVLSFFLALVLILIIIISIMAILARCKKEQRSNQRAFEMSNRQSSYEPPVVVQGERVPAPMGRVPPSKLDSPRGAVV